MTGSRGSHVDARAVTEPALFESHGLEGIGDAHIAHEFQERTGRKPAILHLSNIANNAYNNAKLLAARGFACDVLCADYYHVMACPEWEDADFAGEPSDQFHPDWTVEELGDFRRPAWFVQGPLPLALAYLLARRDENVGAMTRYGRALSLANRTRRWGLGTAIAVAPVLLRPKAARVLRAALSPEVVRRHVRARCRQYGASGVAQTVAAMAAWCSLVLRDASARLWPVTPGEAPDEQLLADFAQAFPQRDDRLSREDIWQFTRCLRLWRQVLSRYDLVLGYGIDPLYPMLAGHQGYFAMEHGTLRSIPWEDTSMGRLTALAYYRARHVFVTNLDCMDSARRLAGERVTFINHPYDEDHGERVSGVAEWRDELLRRTGADHLIFFPTRHDWVPGTGYADKGNDVLLRGFAALRAQGVRVGLICCQWGRNVAQSKALIAELGCREHVFWSEPMGMVRFERTARASDVVADQFKLGAFGGIVFKAMAVGAPICTFLDAAQLSSAFPTPPPVLNCRTAEDVVQEVGALLREPAARERLSVASRAWMKRHHAAADTVASQVRQFEPALREVLQP